MGVRVSFWSTCHFDRFGPARLEEALRRERPDLVTVEATPRQFAVQSQVPQDRSFVTADRVRQLYASRLPPEAHARVDWEVFATYARTEGFEVDITDRYGAATGIPVIGVDAGAGVAVSAQYKRDAFQTDEIAQLFESLQALDDATKYVYELMHAGHGADDALEARLFIRRNHAMAAGIAKAARKLATGKIVHVGGGGHVYGASPTLYGLTKLPKERHILDEIPVPPGKQYL